MKKQRSLFIVLSFIFLTIAELAGTSFTFAQTNPTQTIVKGKTNVKLSEELEKTLTSLNIIIAGIAPAKVKNETSSFPAFTNLSLPLSGGLADSVTGKAVLSHSGGISLIGINTKVQLLNLTIDVSTEKNFIGTITGVVIANDRLVTHIPLFTINIASTVFTPQGKITKLDITDTKTSLTKEAAEVLNKALNTTGFVEGLNIGNLTTTGKTAAPEKKLQFANKVILGSNDEE